MSPLFWPSTCTQPMVALVVQDAQQSLFLMHYPAPGLPFSTPR